MPDSDPETKYYDKDGHEIWKCTYCPKTYRTSGSTTVGIEHWTDFDPTKGHGLEKHSTRDVAMTKQQLSIKHALELAEARKQKRRRLDGDEWAT
ncbi:hypothetical protein OIDMADRAFT_46901 [Oidiodendron maius Zn]|uniref:BED-type domain-containing protein n=1 Tax=Oidiodendron maius (strain Zn) TaxID=913774 RepID=A0A0C3HXP5_OIDMZ|nr:hypothetical protein OIDMADRAFT_46901 [Oidiodendron maius Zn]